jgi:hypothetical protein
MRGLDHFLVLFRAGPDAPPFTEEDRAGVVGPGDGRPTHVVATDSLLLAWTGRPPPDDQLPFLRAVGDAYNLGTARAGEVAAGTAEAVGELDGAFAAFAFHPPTEQCALVTDRFGLFPLYTCAQDGVVGYSTSLDMLLAQTRAPRRLDPTAAAEMLLLGMVLGNRTLVQGVSLAPPATVLQLCAGPPRPSSYWGWRGLAGPTAECPDLAHETAGLVEQAVLRGVPAGARKVGLALDGGPASRLVLAVLRRHGVPVQAYAVEPGGGASSARAVAAALHTPLTFLPFSYLTPGQDLAEVHAAMGCGYHVRQAFAGGVAAQAAADGCEVLFDGLGLDAVLGAPAPAGATTAQGLAAELEALLAGGEDGGLARVLPERALAELTAAVRASLHRSAEEALEAAGARAGDWFAMTHRLRKGAFGTALAGLARLPGRFPGVTTRLFEHGLRLPEALRQEDALYRRLLGELSTELARIPWAPTGRPAGRGAARPGWRAWLGERLRRLGGRWGLPRRGSRGGAFCQHDAVREVLRAEAAGLPDGLGPDAVAALIERRLDGAAQGVYTVKHFARRFLGG